MKIKIFPPVPDFMLERFIPFETSFHGKSWEDFYEAVALLKANHPNEKFKSTPFIYVDLENKRNGYIFIESTTDDLYYVYK